ncbi:MAG: epimerase [Prolixibacteraceae bacterium]|nr:epimerase [Prolixibacteraceae bacterium]
MKVVITGTTGMVGQGVLLECLENESIEKVIVINRHSIGMEHPKLVEVIHENFFELWTIEHYYEECDACFFCLGVSSSGMSKDTYYKITHDLTLNFAESFNDVTSNASFIYVSGEGTNSTEKGKSNWSRVKGKTENDLLLIPFKSAYMFRPGLINPVRGEKSRTYLYNVIYVVVRPLYPLLKLLMPNHVTTTAKLGRAMINAVQKGFEKNILETRDINSVAKL